MVGSAVYGFALGLAFALMSSFSPRWGMAVWVTLLGIHSLWAASECWRRSGLLLSTIGVALAGVWMVGSGVYVAMGHPMNEWGFQTWAFGLSCACINGFLILAERRRHPDLWAAWKRYMDDKSAWDIALGRHFPPFRAAR